VGKYVDLRESYKSLHEALVHGGLANEVQVALTYIDSERVEREGPEGLLSISTASWSPGASGSGAWRVRSWPSAMPGRKKVPYFGICFGMQLAVIDLPATWPTSPLPPAKNSSPMPSTPSST